MSDIPPAPDKGGPLPDGATHPSLLLPLPFRVALWNTAGFWMPNKKDRARKLKAATNILKKYDILLLDEAHVEPAAWEAAEDWATKHGGRLFVALSHRFSSGASLTALESLSQSQRD